MGKYLVAFTLVVLVSCQSSGNKDKVAYQEALSNAFELRQHDNENYSKTHDSLVMVAEFKKSALADIDSIYLKIEDIKARFSYEHGAVPKKVELNLMRIEERTTDLRSKIRYSKEAELNWKGFQDQVNKEISIIKSNLNKL